MNLKHLRKLLDDKGIDPGLYDLQSDSDCVYRIAENPRERYWEVYFFERGGRDSGRRFYDEDEAVHYFIETLTGLQKTMNDVKMRFEKRPPEAQLFLDLYLATDYSLREQKEGNTNTARSIVIKLPLIGKNKIVDITKELSWEKHISNTKKPSEFEYTDKRILARKLMIALERTKRLPIEGEEIAEVAKQIEERVLLEEANKLFDQL